MRRGIFVLALVAILTAATVAVVFWLHRPPPTSHDWLREHYGLSEAQARQISQIESDYQGRCAAMCRRISEADAALDDLMQSSVTVTPEIRAAIAQSDAVRTDCRASMLAHFYEVAAVIPADRRGDYLKMVLPSVRNPEGMAVRVSAP